LSLLPVSLLVTSNALSHRKVGDQISRVVKLPLRVVTHDWLPGYEMYPALLYVGTFDYASVARFSAYHQVSGRSTFYGTCEGIPVLTPRSIRLLGEVGVYAVSGYVAERLGSLGVDAEVLHHGVEVVEEDEEFSGWLERLRDAGSGRLVLWIGANQARKGLDVLSELAGMVDADFLVLTGEGEVDLEPLRRRENVHLLLRVGGLTENQLASMFRVSDVLISTSLAEGFGLPVAEAIAYGCRVLVPDLPPFREFVREDYIVPVEREWLELYRGYMWFEMRRVDVGKFAGRLEWILDGGGGGSCGRWSPIEVYNTFRRSLSPFW